MDSTNFAKMASDAVESYRVRAERFAWIATVLRDKHGIQDVRLYPDDPPCIMINEADLYPITIEDFRGLDGEIYIHRKLSDAVNEASFDWSCSDDEIVNAVLGLLQK